MPPTKTQQIACTTSKARLHSDGLLGVTTMPLIEIVTMIRHNLKTYSDKRIVNICYK